MLEDSKKSAVLKRILGKESYLVDSYILAGPTALRASLAVDEAEWRIIFDHLVFEHGLLVKTVTASTDFFVESYIKFGMSHVREILDTVDSRYDLIMEVIFDFVAIANEGLYYHVLEHRDRYMTAFRARGRDFVRKVLGIWRAKYEESWAMVLDVLLNAVCDAIFTENTFEHGLRAFAHVMNNNREHRPLVKHNLSEV